MMEIQKILKPKGKIVIVSDFREKEVSEHLKKLGAVVNEQALEVGDFVCSERVCIEKKTGNDFVSSIIDGRIFEQASALKKNFEKPIIIIEGYSYREINENALKAALASLLIDFGISILTTRIPGVSTITAKKLLQHFGNVEKIFTANEKELQKARIGKKIAEKIRKLLTINYY